MAFVEKVVFGAVCIFVSFVRMNECASDVKKRVLKRVETMILFTSDAAIGSVVVAVTARRAAPDDDDVDDCVHCCR